MLLEFKFQSEYERAVKRIGSPVDALYRAVVSILVYFRIHA